MKTGHDIYLDYAAATPMDERVFAAMQPYFSEQFYNPSATYQAARDVSQRLNEARAQVAHWLGSRPAEIIFTAGGTEANNLAVHGVVRQFPDANLVVSAIEHESVLAPAHKYDCREAGVAADGTIDLPSLAGLIDDNTVLVSLMYANNEIGTIQPLRKVADLIEAERKKRRQQGNDRPIYLHSDACQAGAYLDLHASRLGVDMMTLNGGKIYGPKQSGVLYVNSAVRLSAQVLGGGQERGLRSGTENVAGSIGFAVALQLAQENRHQESRRLQELQGLFRRLLSEKLPQAAINGSLKHRLPNNVHVTLPGRDNERLLILLDEAGIMAAAGSACSASNEEASHVLAAIGLTEDDARASLRFTMGHGTTEKAVEHTVQTLSRIV